MSHNNSIYKKKIQLAFPSSEFNSSELATVRNFHPWQRVINHSKWSGNRTLATAHSEWCCIQVYFIKKSTNSSYDLEIGDQLSHYTCKHSLIIKYIVQLSLFKWPQRTTSSSSHALKHHIQTVSHVLAWSHSQALILKLYICQNL